MEWIAKYGHRALAASYLLMLALLFAMTVGQGQSLGSAIQAWGVMALAVLLGYLAGREATKAQGGEHV